MASANRLNGNLELDVVIVACAISAGIHAALVRGHFEESAAAGVGFLAAAGVLAALVAVMTDRTASLVTIAVAGAVLAGLLASYALATTTGVPVLHPERESLDGLALATKAIEALGLVAALHLFGQGRAATASNQTRAKGVQT